MKVYVDELPKDCWECIFADNQKGYCDLQETRILRQFTKRDVGCPLQSLTDYTKQVCDNLALSLVEFSEDFTMSRDEILEWLQKYKDQIENEKESN